MRLREGYLALMKAEGNCSSIWVLEGGEGEGGVTVVGGWCRAVGSGAVPAIRATMHHLVPAPNPVSGGTGGGGQLEEEEGWMIITMRRIKGG